MRRKDYQWLFDQYLYTRACPQLEWNYQYDYSIGSYEMRYIDGRMFVTISSCPFCFKLSLKHTYCILQARCRH